MAIDNQSHDFFAGTDVALHNLRWQINGLRQTYPTIDQGQLQQFLVPGQTNSTRDNAFSLILHRPWEEQLEMHRQIRLVNLFAIYEGWISATADELCIDAKKKREAFENGLQAARGYSPTDALAEIGPTSAVMMKVAKDCGGHNLSRNTVHLDSLITCYRAFKEIRNAITHNGSIVNQRAVDVWHLYEAQRAGWSVPRSQAPRLQQPVVGNQVELSSYELVGFSHILLLLMTTIDSVAAGSAKGLEDAVRRWKAAYGKSTMLPGDRAKAVGLAKAHGSFRSKWRRAGLPRLSDDTELYDEFRSRQLIF